MDGLRQNLISSFARCECVGEKKSASLDDDMSPRRGHRGIFLPGPTLPLQGGYSSRRSQKIDDGGLTHVSWFVLQSSCKPPLFDTTGTMAFAPACRASIVSLTVWNLLVFERFAFAEILRSPQPL